MDLYSFLATIILITSVVSLVMAVAAYVAYKIRDVRKPHMRKLTKLSEHPELIFLRPVNRDSFITEWRENPDKSEPEPFPPAKTNYP